jgi:hypothetical protein
MRVCRLSFVLSFCLVWPATAHEFWIEPEQYQVESGDAVVASLRNGEKFEGISLAWFESRFTRFDMVLGDTVRPVEGRMGDTPALKSEAWQDGLLTVLHETAPSTVTYRDWAKFERFAEHKDFPTATAEHEARGWPKDVFRESYTRHVKALIAVGDGAGQDRAFGMETEFVALTNPYDAAFDGNMRVQVNYQDAPRADAQIEVFAKAPDGSVEITLHRTDARGQATIPVAPSHEYLFDAVVLRPSPLAGTEERAPVWETLWAALTFAVPPL